VQSNTCGDQDPLFKVKVFSYFFAYDMPVGKEIVQENKSKNTQQQAENSRFPFFF